MSIEFQFSTLLKQDDSDNSPLQLTMEQMALFVNPMSKKKSGSSDNTRIQSQWSKSVLEEEEDNDESKQQNYIAELDYISEDILLNLILEPTDSIILLYPLLVIRYFFIYFY